MTLAQHLIYEPNELAFGTSGLRGLVSDMTDLECYLNTLGFIQYLKVVKVISEGAEVFVAGDLRPSTPKIMKAVFVAIKDSGCIPINCGFIPTPAAALRGYVEKKSCVVVTGSHIPADRNGIKYYKPDGEILKADEDYIKSHVSGIRNKLYQEEFETSAFDKYGSFKDEVFVLPEVNKIAERQYFDRYTELFNNKPLQGKQIVVYQHSAVGRDILVNILRELGSEVVEYGRSEVFLPIDTENVTLKDKALFKKIAYEFPEVFAIVSTDGDSDRPFVIDEQGIFHRGDILGCLVAKYLLADYAAVPVSSNDAVDIYCGQNNIALDHTKIGSPYVIDAMQKVKNKSRIVGWEVNGGFLLGSDMQINGHKLSALPTRDAILPILCVLVKSAESKQKISSLFNRLPKRYTEAGLIEGLEWPKVEKFVQLIKTGGINSSTLGAVFSVKKFGIIDRLDFTDGLRIYFNKGEVIHVRPSGNAPQLRLYVNANSQQLADEIVADGIKDGGLLSKLIDIF